MNDNSNVDQRSAAWNEFVGSQKTSASIDPLITDSWKRCWGRFNPYQSIHLQPLHADHLLTAQVASFDLISVARPVMEDIYQFIERTSTALVLVNSAGCILDLLGDPDILDYLDALGIRTGVFISESQIGTNAFALALMERVTIQVTGAEHYLQQYQGICEAATPIFDLSGRPLGAFGLITFAERSQPHLLGLSVAGARAIEGQRASDQLLAEQNKQLAGLNAILNSISEGILVWNSERVLMHVNEAAAKMAGFPVRSLVGRKVGDLLSYPAFVKAAIENKEPLTDVEANIKFGDHTCTSILSLRFVEKHNELQWIIVSFRLGKDVTRLVQRQFGAQASFQLGDLAGQSPAMKKVRRLAHSAAAARASILIRGENGTGKTLLANAIHNESPRREGPFLVFSCSSMPAETVIPELLGYEEGTANGQPGGRLSKFELAQGGTLYLQDIDALPLEAQLILLNILEIGIVRRLGSDRPIPIDVRIIASSSADFEKLIEEGDFRSDLYYRISPFEISIPPLRERVSDIPTLADRILSRLSHQLRRNLSLSPVVLELLKKYPWPGNLRELDAVISRATGQVDASGCILPEHLPPFILKPVKILDGRQRPVEPRSFEEIEEDIFYQTADLCRGNVSEMARVLGVGRTTVWRKLKEYNIAIQEFRLRPGAEN